MIQTTSFFLQTEEINQIKLRHNKVRVIIMVATYHEQVYSIVAILLKSNEPVGSIPPLGI